MSVSFAVRETQSRKANQPVHTGGAETGVDVPDACPGFTRNFCCMQPRSAKAVAVRTGLDRGFNSLVQLVVCHVVSADPMPRPA